MGDLEEYKAKQATAAAAKAEKEEAEKKKDGDEEEDDKEPPPEGNGGSTDRYNWTQTLGALEVIIPIKPGTRAKQVVCDIGVGTLKVGIKGEPLLIDGKMHAKVKP